MEIREVSYYPKRRTNKSLKEMIWVTENDIEENIVCDVCLDGVPWEEEVTKIMTDEVVICYVCNLAVH
jgi:hypothetical protein